jgi:hypothetical protein
MRVPAMLMVVLAGCAATGGDLQDTRDSWSGAVYDDVVARWGHASRHTTLADGGYVYTWQSESTAPRGRLYPSVGIFGGSGGVGVGTGVTFGGGGGELIRCDRTLVFRNGRVAEQTWQGDPAFCESFRR